MTYESKYEVDAATGCWNWLLCLDRGGYGVASFQGRYARAHRLIYELHKGPIPEGLVIDHLCRNRRCVNPDHLEPVTQRENLLRGDTFQARNAAKTHCIHGHPLSGENLYVHPGRGVRDCRTCRRESTRRRYKAKGSTT